MKISIGLISLLLSVNIIYGIEIENFDSLSAWEYVNNFTEDSVERQELFESLEEAGGNWLQLVNALKELDSESVSDGIYLINSATHLDRIVMTPEILSDHITYAYKAKETVHYEIPDSLFTDYILPFRISYEPAEAYREILYNKFFPMIKKKNSSLSAGKEIAKWAHKNIRITTDRDFYGPMQSPILTLERKIASEGEFVVFLVASLRSVGIVSRRLFVPVFGVEKGGRSFLEIYSDGNWYPLYPSEPEQAGNFKYLENEYSNNVTIVVAGTAFGFELVTENYTSTGFAQVRLFENKEPAKDFEHFSINVYNYGSLDPLDYLQTKTDSSGIFVGELGDGDYILIAGQRDRTGSAHIVTRPFSIIPGETTKVSLDISLPSYIKPNIPKGNLPPYVLPDLSDSMRTYSEFMGKPTYYILYNDDEPSKRLFTELSGLQLPDSTNLVLIYEGRAKIEDFPSTTHLIDKGKQLLPLIDQSDNLPLILYLNSGELKYELLGQGFIWNPKTLFRKRNEN